MSQSPLSSLSEESASSFPVVPVFTAIFSQLCDAADQRFAISSTAYRQHLQVGSSVFEAASLPSISVADYVARIKKYTECPMHCLVVSLIYIDRLIAMHEGFALHSRNFHRLFLTSTMMSAKFFEDVYFNNAYWAKVGGVTNAELNCQELHFLSLIRWDFNVSRELYDQYFAELTHFARRDGLIPSSADSSPPSSASPSVTAQLSADVRDLHVTTPTSVESIEDADTASDMTSVCSSRPDSPFEDSRLSTFIPEHADTLIVKSSASSQDWLPTCKNGEFVTSTNSTLAPSSHKPRRSGRQRRRPVRTRAYNVQRLASEPVVETQPWPLDVAPPARSSSARLDSAGAPRRRRPQQRPSRPLSAEARVSLGREGEGGHPLATIAGSPGVASMAIDTAPLSWYCAPSRSVQPTQSISCD